ncbi:hypothetical protein CR513_17358, partial [Mucuna pruriens]
MAYDQSGNQRKLQLQELEELRLEIDSENGVPSRPESKLHSRWEGPFFITNFFPHGTKGTRIRDKKSWSFNKLQELTQNQSRGPRPTTNDSPILGNSKNKEVEEKINKAPLRHPYGTRAKTKVMEVVMDNLEQQHEELRGDSKMGKIPKILKNLEATKGNGGSTSKVAQPTPNHPLGFTPLQTQN